MCREGKSLDIDMPLQFKSKIEFFPAVPPVSLTASFFYADPSYVSAPQLNFLAPHLIFNFLNGAENIR